MFSNAEENKGCIDVSQEDPKSKCKYCGKLYRSVNIHISKARPEEHRVKIAQRYDADTSSVESIYLI